MKYLIPLLLLSSFCFGEYYAELSRSDESLVSWYVSDPADLEFLPTDRVRVELDQSEYDFLQANGTAPQAKIDAALAAATANDKDVSQVTKLEKAAFLVLLDYCNTLGISKTVGQFKTEVEAKYDTLS